MDPALLKAALDAGGWAFAEVSTLLAGVMLVRHLFGLLGDQQRQIAALTAALDRQTGVIEGQNGVLKDHTAILSELRGIMLAFRRD